MKFVLVLSSFTRFLLYINDLKLGLLGSCLKPFCYHITILRKKNSKSFKLLRKESQTNLRLIPEGFKFIGQKIYIFYMTRLYVFFIFLTLSLSKKTLKELQRAILLAKLEITTLSALNVLLGRVLLFNRSEVYFFKARTILNIIFINCKPS